jgi:dUTP pyrophosphatase
MILKFKKTHEKGIEPVRSNPSDAGMDLHYSPEEGETVMIPPLGKALLSTGISVEVPHGYALEIKSRSSLASKRGLIVGACLVDPGYSGEIKIGIHNISQMPQDIYPGDKIAQFVVYPIVHVRLEEADELYEDDVAISDRADGGFGSTDNKEETE